MTGRPHHPEAAVAEPHGHDASVRECLKPGDTLRANLDRIEAWLIRRALEQNGQRRTATAKKLGITREGLYK